MFDGRVGRERVEARVAPDAVGALGGRDPQREVAEVVVADVHDAGQRVLRIVGPGRIAPGARRDAAGIRPAALGALVTDLHAAGLARGRALEADLPVDLVGAREEQVDAGVATRGGRRPHAGRPVLVVAGREVGARVEDQRRPGLEVGVGRVADVVARLLEPVDGRDLVDGVPVALPGQGLVVGPVEGHLDRPRRVGDGVAAAGVPVVERPAAPAVVGLEGRERAAVQHVGLAAVVADGEDDEVVVGVVGADDAQQVDARRPRARGREGRGHGPVRAVDEAQRRVAVAGGLRTDGDRLERREEARARAAVVARAVDLDVHRRRRGRVDLQADRLAVVDALRGREALDAGAGVAERPVAAAGAAVLDDDGVARRARGRRRAGLDGQRVGRLDAGDDGADGVEVGRAVRRRRVQVGRGGDAARGRDPRGDRPGRGAAVDVVGRGAGGGLPGEVDPPVEGVGRHSRRWRGRGDGRADEHGHERDEGRQPPPEATRVPVSVTQGATVGHALRRGN